MRQQQQMPAICHRDDLRDGKCRSKTPDGTDWKNRILSTVKEGDGNVLQGLR